MDVNGTKFSLIQGQADWVRCRALQDDGSLSEPGDFGEDTGLAFDEWRSDLTLFPQLFLFAGSPGAPTLTLEQRRGAARDRFGNGYWVSPDQNSVLVWTEGSAAPTPFWRPGPGPVCTEPAGAFQPAQTASPVALEFAGLAVTEDHYLVAGILGPAGHEGFLVFDLAAGGEPRHYLWPRTVAFAPFDMAARAGGGVWILDRENHRFWEVDRHFNIVTLAEKPGSAQRASAGFGPAAPETPPQACVCIPGQSVAVTDAVSFNEDVCAIETAAPDTILLLERPPSDKTGFSKVSVYRHRKLCGSPLDLGSIADHLPTGQKPAFSLIGHDFAFVLRATTDPVSQVGRLYVVSNLGHQAFAFDLWVRGDRFDLKPVIVYLPMRAFGGKALVGAAAKTYYDFDAVWIPLIEQQRPSYPTEATIETRVFDSGQPQCVWHRLFLDACLPHEAQVQVWSRTVEELGPPDDPFSGAPWLSEPALLKRSDGSEQPFRPAPTSPDRGTFELLFQQARGRYLQLRLRLSGNGRVTPRLRALRAYYPRFSYLEHYLPAVYRQDTDSASFLDRFLANFEGSFTAIEDRIAAVQVLFDPRNAPAEALEWLGDWFGVALDPAWSEAKQRIFIQHAIDFFDARGTIPGLKMALRLALEDPPSSHFLSGDLDDQRCADRIRVIERFRTRRTPGVVLGDPTDAVGPRPVSGAARWLPSDGADELHRRYREFLKAAQQTPQPDAQFPLVEPTDAGAAALWQSFGQIVLGFIPSAASDDLQQWRDFLASRYTDITELNSEHRANYASFDKVPLPLDLPEEGALRQDWIDFVLESVQLNAGTRQDLWQSFLARRYRSRGNLNTAYGTNWTSFAQVLVPQAVPSNPAALQDWFQFESIVLAMHEAAHKFVVLLPVTASDYNNLAGRQAQLSLAQRLIDLEKPAHTMFDVKFYWAMFRVGAARLEDDTLVGLGSRAPELLTPMVLNQGFLLESYLAPAPPRDTPGRFLLGSSGV